MKQSLKVLIFKILSSEEFSHFFRLFCENKQTKNIPKRISSTFCFFVVLKLSPKNVFYIKYVFMWREMFVFFTDDEIMIRECKMDQNLYEILVFIKN